MPTKLSTRHCDPQGCSSAVTDMLGWTVRTPAGWWRAQVEVLVGRIAELMWIERRPRSRIGKQALKPAVEPDERGVGAVQWSGCELVLLGTIDTVLATSKADHGPHMER